MYFRDNVDKRGEGGEGGGVSKQGWELLGFDEGLKKDLVIEYKLVVGQIDYLLLFSLAFLLLFILVLLLEDWLRVHQQRQELYHLRIDLPQELWG